MQLKTILNSVQSHPGFVFQTPRMHARGKKQWIDVPILARRRSRPVCSGCGKKCPGYDTLGERRYQFVPLWAIPVFFAYAPRRCNCPRCGVKVELLPWSEGKSTITTAFAWFLSSWAKVLSWTETARRFGTSWAIVFQAVRRAVEWGKAHRNLDNITAIGVDELSWKKGHKYLTVVYQINRGCRRLLWIGRDRTAATFSQFFDWLGVERTAALHFVVSDMWRAFIGTVARRANHAVHILDRFHVAKLCNDAIDQVRRAEARKLREKGDSVTLKHTRWVLVKRRVNLRGKQRSRLRELLEMNLATVRAYLLKEDLCRFFWSYKSPTFAARFLDGWIVTALASRIDPMVKLATTLDDHRDLLLNWFRAKGALAMGAIEGMNNKARVTTKLAYGFRSYEHGEIALFHRLGALPEPPWLTHRFT
jgi:transposase